ncbi:MAG: spore coat protein CotJB [Lachnospiraceae bacterium]|nr:spore coat protein CotJB [Lachnospiraceae bacterium]
MQNRNMTCSDRVRLLEEIGKVDFAMKDLNLYLDTHPSDVQAIESFRYYNSVKKQLMKEFAEKYGPLSLDNVEADAREWSWSLQPSPWERGYH